MCECEVLWNLRGMKSGLWALAAAAEPEYPPREVACSEPASLVVWWPPPPWLEVGKVVAMSCPGSTTMFKLLLKLSLLSTKNIYTQQSNPLSDQHKDKNISNISNIENAYTDTVVCRSIR